MEKLTETLAMGGYAIYVWPSFIITAMAMLGMVFVSVRPFKQAQKSLAELQEMLPLSSDN